ncbi:D-isomer specific 2-hydroxyacid dehydrogenase [Saccharata proteae CBS 121410]|uniref:D-isomer specific 2-hydroxyacid dehydrogenase n=1 Tax=Saccharata proteae CBS 121410 TaxID=1314787 RepID=A0A9P4HZA7_9PEZI|nr:D-isomer specific 2-hydroxyacid dehydrogenase [Saccharata proteae CBS 121410]
MSPPSTPPPLKMAILDDYQNLSTPHFSSIPATQLQTTHFPTTLPPPPASNAALIARLHPYHIICAMRERTPLPAAVLAHLPNLRLILTTGTRNQAIDLDACAARGIAVAGTPSDRPAPPATPKTTQHLFALILALTNNIPRDNNNTLLFPSPGAGGPHWQAPSPVLSTQLAGKTFAVLGFGKLGTAAARVAWFGFGMRVVAWSASLTQADADERAAGVGMPRGAVEVVASKAEAFERADVLSLQYVLGERSRGMVGRAELALLKRGAVFVNTARAGLVDEDALFEVLCQGRIRGAALDVWWREPMDQMDRWRVTRWGEEGRSALVATPHTAYVTEETMEAWWRLTKENLERWLRGEDVVSRLA